MPERPLGPGQHRVVVGEDRAGGALAEQLAVDPRGAADEAVGRGARDQVLELAAAALGGDREAPVLDEAAGVDQVGEVLARRPAAGGVAALDRLGPRRVLGQRPARQQLGQVVALGVAAVGPTVYPPSPPKIANGFGGRSAQATCPEPSAVDLAAARAPRRRAGRPARGRCPRRWRRRPGTSSGAPTGSPRPAAAWRSSTASRWEAKSTRTSNSGSPVRSERPRSEAISASCSASSADVLAPGSGSSGFSHLRLAGASGAAASSIAQRAPAASCAISLPAASTCSRLPA